MQQYCDSWFGIKHHFQDTNIIQTENTAVISINQSINQSIIALMKYDKTHIMTKYVLIRVLKNIQVVVMQKCPADPGAGPTI